VVVNTLQLMLNTLQFNMSAPETICFYEKVPKGSSSRQKGQYSFFYQIFWSFFFNETG